MTGLRVVFDGPPGPEGGRFVECENARGESVNAGEWREREDGRWELVIDSENARLRAERPAFPKELLRDGELAVLIADSAQPSVRDPANAEVAIPIQNAFHLRIVDTLEHLQAENDRLAEKWKRDIVASVEEFSRKRPDLAALFTRERMIEQEWESRRSAESIAPKLYELVEAMTARITALEAENARMLAEAAEECEGMREGDLAALTEAPP